MDRERDRASRYHSEALTRFMGALALSGCRGLSRWVGMGLSSRP